MPNDTLDIHEDILSRFKRLKEKGRLAQAYLFIGPAEIGKSQTAHAVAKMLLCAKGDKYFCDECPACVKVNHMSHPDVTLIEAEEGTSTIKIEQVRNLLAQVRFMPFESERKVFIIKDIDQLTIESANALLKTLEEPTKSSLLILTSSVLEKVLPTVRSRCQKVHFLPQPQEKIIQHLEGKFVESFASAHYLAYFAEGCLKKAQRLKEEGFFETKNLYLDEFLFSSDCENFLKEVTSDKKKCEDFILIIISWMRDCLLLKAGVLDKRLINLDRKSELSDFQARFTFDELNDIYNQAIFALRQFRDNLNVKLSLQILREMFHG